VQYIINGSIVFDKGDGTLKHPETNDAVQLPLPAQRLLLIILESGGEILSRDFLFREVWDKFGLTGSNSNLNQYLSLLRRNMMVFGCENFVITLPKVGIRLDEHINIMKDPEEEVSEHPYVPEPVEPQEKKKSDAFFFKGSLIGLTVLIFITLASVWILYVRNTARDPVFSVHTLQAGCVIHTTKSESEYHSEKIENQVLKILKENSLPCRKGFNVYFDYYTSSTPQTYGRTMLSLCRPAANGVNRACDNIYYLDRKEIND